jgi:acyl transferase domain-containing protein/thioesterase domain-containing protein
MQAATQSDSRIAITGTAFHFPGEAVSLGSYWALLDSGRSAMRDTPEERFDITPFLNPNPDTPGTTYARRAGYVDGAFEFDAGFFRISRAEALSMDPQQRWMLELCWAALENAGIVPSEIRGQNVGLFLASGEVDYGRRTVWSGDLSRITTYARLGSNKAILARRIAYFLGVHGPAVLVDTACSSSLTAVHLAAQSLHTGDCDIAIAGGVSLILGPEETIAAARRQTMSRSETCRPFDADADGYMRGEGGGVIVMKRLEDAFSDGDRIDAVLAGSAINNDGPSNGLTAPNGIAQERVIRLALERAKAKPESVAYVEAHGTGTPLGDPIELTALRNVYSKDVQRTRPLLVGSVKAQIGDLESAAGIAGLIKAMLVLRHRCVPAQANFSEPNPRFRWEGRQIRVPRTSETLAGEDALIGVSAISISGTNVHLLLAQPSAPDVAADASQDRVLTLSARSRDGCVQLAKAYRQLLGESSAALRDICYTASVRRDHWSHRVALVGAMREDFARALDDFIDGNPTGTWHSAEVPKARRLVFLFPGQGAWKSGMGAGLYKDNPFFHRFVNECLKRLDTTLANEVLSAIKGEHPEAVRHQHGQLAHFVFLYSLARTWMELGQRPDVVIGHSLGEHVAAVIAGVMSVEDGLKAVEARGRLFDTATPPGAMLAVAASVKELHDTYDMPGNSPLLESTRAGFAAVLSELRFELPKIQMISTLTGRTAADDIARVDHWLDLVEQPVLFADALNQLAGEDCVFLEVGPGAALTNLARAATQKRDRAISSLGDAPDGDERPEPTGFAHACGRLYCVGFMRNWAALYPQPPRPAEAPTYPFERTHFELPFVTGVASSTDWRAFDDPDQLADQSQSTAVTPTQSANAATAHRSQATAHGAASNALPANSAGGGQAAQGTPDDAIQTRQVYGADLDDQSPVVVLREGPGEILALVHPVGGNVLCYQDLAAAWPGNPTVVGLKHPDSDVPELHAHRPLAELARLYCGELERVLGRLPDRLGGWSLGGLVAHEMVAQWEKAGRVSPPLMMIDSPLPTGELSLKIKGIVEILSGPPTLSVIDSLQLDARFLNLLNKDLGFEALRARMVPANFARLARLYASNAVALASHSPATIEAPIIYALAAKGSNGRSCDDVTPHLGGLTQGVVSVGVFDDDHNSIVQLASAHRLAAFFSGTNVGEADIKC